MDLGLKDKTALVAAASRGLGRAAALALSGEGARVTVCSRTEKTIKKAAESIARETGGEVLPVVCDVTNKSQIQTLVREVVDTFGGIDVLVTNAGGPPAGLATDFTVDDYRAGVELNLMSTIELCYQVLPVMKKNNWGRIIAVASIAARQPVDHLILSNTARAGVLGFLKTLSAQVAMDGITVNSICPGYTKTERIEELAAMFAETGQGTVEEFYHKIEAEVPMKRMGTPAEFADAVAFLASERASYITGVALPVDGGYIKALF
jgi:3-oxoacyl-[acyl-carrier protein] reductase